MLQTVRAKSSWILAVVVGDPGNAQVISVLNNDELAVSPFACLGCQHRALGNAVEGGVRPVDLIPGVRESGQIVVADRVKIALANDVHSGAIAWNQVADRPINLLPKKVRPRAGGLGTAVQVARPCAANHDLAVAVDLRCGMWVR